MASEAGETATSYRSKLTTAAAGLLRRAGVRPRHGTASAAAGAAGDDAYLSLREEWLRGKKKEQQTEKKIKQWVSQPAGRPLPAEQALACTVTVWRWSLFPRWPSPSYMTTPRQVLVVTTAPRPASRARRLTAQLARTEEAAKRILTRTDPSARGGAAARLLELEREASAMHAERAELQSELEK